ncbi:MAG TPA: hypothetical protein VHE77_21985 [Dongiaceae bacterium]|jgi:hypothetical protein|nr:hypothetical protein [Dongiaceae bacterium]
MPFVRRNAQGRIVSVHREQDSPDLQYLPPNTPEVMSFLAPGNERRGELQRSDMEMIRAYEDLTDILLSKRIITLTDFPPAAQEKLLRRKKMRSSLSPIAEALAAPEDEGGLP